MMGTDCTNDSGDGGCSDYGCCDKEALFCTNNYTRCLTYSTDTYKGGKSTPDDNGSSTNLVWLWVLLSLGIVALVITFFVCKRKRKQAADAAVNRNL